MENAKQLVKLLADNALSISTMESCTGGAVINSITNVEGSSVVTQGGYVTYSNAQKLRLGVDPNIIEHYGVYSQACAASMASTAQRLMDSSIAVGITGTLSNTDLNNADSKPGEVHYCIYGGRPVAIILNRTIQVPIMARDLQKGYITHLVLCDVLQVVEDVLSQ